jgi:ABC-2 type transport system permease protein
MGSTALELTMLLRDARARVTLCLFAVVVLLMGISAWAGNHRSDDDKMRVAAHERERWLGQGEKDAHSAAHYSVYVFRLSQPLEALDPGIGPYVGQAVWLEPHWRNEMEFRPLQDVEAFQRLGFPNPARFIVEYGPLLVFLIAFTATAGDRERGTLRLVLGAARHPGGYVWGKWAATAIPSAAALLIPAALVGVAALVSAPAGDGWPRLGLWLAGAAAYIAGLAAVGVAVCLRSRSARTAFMALLALWLALAFAAPRVASALAERLTSLPNYQSIQLQLAREAPIYWSAEQEKLQIGKLLAKYGVTREQDLPVDLRGALIDFNERESHGVFDRVLGGFHDRVVRQDLTFAMQAWLSPAVGLQALSSAMRGRISRSTGTFWISPSATDESW